nr:CREB binding protein [Hymenolepis microstoma]
MSSFSQVREQSINDISHSDDAYIIASKHMRVLRHAITCQSNDTAIPCQYSVCKEMRSLLDHAFNCSNDSDCTVSHCDICKRLVEHLDSCSGLNCRLCSVNSFYRNPISDTSPNSHHLVNGIQMHSNSSSVALNGFDWRTRYGPEIRDQLVRSYAGQVFNPETYNDSRSDVIFSVFQQQEAKCFKDCNSEEEYRAKLKRYVDRLQNELKNKLEKHNGNSISPSTIKAEPVEQINPRSQSSLLYSGGSTGFTSGSAPGSSNGKSIENMDSTIKPKPESSTSSNDAVSSVKTEEISDAQSISKHDPSTSSGPSSIDQKQLHLFNERRCIWTKEQLQNAFLPLVSNIYNQEPHSIHFRVPVAYEELRLTDYPSIVPNPMDLSTIEKKLQIGDYEGPWDVVDDFWLMFNNAWRYNRKNTKIYKACTKLSEIFESLIDPLMRDLGFCCGRAYVHHPHVLSCLTEKSCNINRDDIYYVCETTDKEQKKEFLDKYIVCDKCYQSAGSTITIDDQSSPVHLEKSRFKKQVNNTIVHEKFVHCRECGRKWHKVCACHMDEIWPSGFVCDNCRKTYNIPKASNRFTAKRLPKCKLSEFLEKRVNDFMKKNEPNTKEVTIRVLASGYKSVEVKKYMREVFYASGKFPESFPYKTKAIFAFQEVDGQEVCFFGLYVQEYSSDCPPPNTRRVYIAYLDSVYFFQPKQYRTDIYHEILIGYMHYAKKQGYANAHIWACPPGEGDDYIFHMHPVDQKIPKPKRLQDWYRKMLQKGHNERIVFDYKNIYEDASETKHLLPTDLPYFDGDLWPNTMEELLKPLVENRRRLKEEEAAEECVEGEEDCDSNHGSLDCDRKPGSAGSGSGLNGMDNRKKTKKRKIKRAGSSLNIPGSGSKRKRLTAVSNEETEAEVQRRLEENLQRHADAFLTINLYNPNQVPNLQPIKDPDPLLSSELMECRDSFLSRARERHLEFSTLRRAKFSTLTFLYEIHQENKDTIIYVCAGCKAETETPRICKQCMNFYLCEECFKARGHDHPMTRVVVSDDSANNASVQQSDRLRMEKCVALLKHTSICRDANCRVPSCRDIKRRLSHMESPHDRTKCIPCRQMHRIIVAHSAKCNDANCQVIFCAQLKAMKKQQESQQRLRKLQTLRRRQKTMQCANSNNIQTSQQPNTPQQASTSGAPCTSNSSVPQHATTTTTTASPTVLSGPGSTDTPQSFNSQMSMASPHAVPRSSPPKPTSVPTHPSTLQYSHSSPYQSPMAATGSRSIGCNQQPAVQQHHTPTEFQQTPAASSFVQQQQSGVYQQQMQHAPQLHQSKSYSSSGDISFVRQQSNPSQPPQQFYENGQPQRGHGFMNNPMMSMSPRQQPHFQPQQPSTMNPNENEDMYTMQQQQQQSSLKRPYFNESDMMGPSGNMYNNNVPPMSQPPPPKQMRVMMPSQSQQPQISSMQQQNTQLLDQQQQTAMHWSGGQPQSNGGSGQIMPPAVNKMSLQMRQPAQQIVHGISPNQTSTPPAHLMNPSAGQAPTSVEVETVVSARRNFTNEMEFNTWLHQNPQFIPAWNYIRTQQQHHQKGIVPSKPPLQYAQPQPMPVSQNQPQQQQMMMRGGGPGPGGYINHIPPQRMMPQQQIPGQIPMSNSSWQQQMQQPGPPQESWGVRQPCYAPPQGGKLPYSQNPQQQQMVQNSPYPVQQQQPGGFPSHRYAPPLSHGNNPPPGVMLRPPVASHRIPGPPLSPRTQQPPMYVSTQQGPPQQQQNSMMLSQLLVQPHPQPQRMQDGVLSHQQHQSLPSQQPQIPR